MWKTIVILNQFVFVFVSILTPLAIAPLTEVFMMEFQKTLPQVNLLFGVAAITLGYANFLIVPAANVFGRRPIIIICGLVCVLANIWQALVTSFPSFLAARVISGLGAAANESIMPMVVADLFFVHQRGRSMTLYFWSYFLGIFIGPVIAGSIAARVNWRWFFWVCTILQAASLLFMIVAHPETKYERAAAPEAVAALQQQQSPIPEESDTEKTTTTDPKTGEAPTLAASTSVSHSDRPVGGPSRTQFSLVPRPRFSRGGPRGVLRDVFAPLQIFAFPIVLWASLTMGFSSNCLLALNLTEAQVFGPPPYLFNSAQIGYTNFAFAVGAIVALCTAGPLSDWIALRRARRAAGVLEAEYRLWSALPYVACCLVGMVVTAVGYQWGWRWEVIVVVGYGLVGVQTVGVPAVVIAYAVDCYKTLPGEIMIAATVIKNTFGVSSFLFPCPLSLSLFLSTALSLLPFSTCGSILLTSISLLVRHGLLLQRLGSQTGLHRTRAHPDGDYRWLVAPRAGGLHTLWEEVPGGHEELEPSLVVIRRGVLASLLSLAASASNTSGRCPLCLAVVSYYL